MAYMPMSRGLLVGSTFGAAVNEHATPLSSAKGGSMSKSGLLGAMNDFAVVTAAAGSLSCHLIGTAHPNCSYSPPFAQSHRSPSRVVSSRELDR